MRPVPVVLLLASLALAGCASDPPATGATADGPAQPGAAAPFAAPAASLQFAVGNSTGNLTGTETYSITEQCFVDCPLGGEHVIDLSPIIPANAPVELLVTVFGANSILTYEDTYAIGVNNSQRAQLQGSTGTYAGLFVRGETGKVELHVYNPGGFSIPPDPAPTASWTAQSLVRADVLLPGIPAGVELAPGDRLNLTGASVQEAILVAPDGRATRDAVAPFELVANGTAGAYTLLMLGREASPVQGPAGATLAARRLALVEGAPQAIASGTPSTWTFDAPSAPLLVGVGLRHTDTANGFTAAPVVTQWEGTVTSPGNVEVASGSATCTPSCGFVLLAVGGGPGRYELTATSDFLADALGPGTYTATATYTGTAMEGAVFAVVLA